MAITEEELREAEARMQQLRSASATADAARYDRRIGRVVIRMSSGLDVAVSPHDVQGLERARPADLDAIEISPSGIGVHFSKLDGNIYLPALLQGFTGSGAWMAARATESHDRATVGVTRRTGTEA
jgi:Protein of unknown function (DUF2442)